MYCPPGYADINGERNGGWRNECNQNGMEDIRKLSIAAHERRSKKMRDDIKHYFNGIGKVEWQYERAGIQND